MSRSGRGRQVRGVRDVGPVTGNPTVCSAGVEERWQDFLYGLRIDWPAQHSTGVDLAGYLAKIASLQTGVFASPCGWEHRAISLMAGGDFALIKSAEGFEDFTTFGRRQLAELGVGSNDIVFAITEGGETSFVEDLMISRRPSHGHFFLFHLRIREPRGSIF